MENMFDSSTVLFKCGTAEEQEQISKLELWHCEQHVSRKLK